MAENQKDLKPAGKLRGLDAALLDRLELTDARIEAMAEGLRQIAALADPVGAISDLELPSIRYPGWAHACTAGRHRHHLRIAAQCNG